MLDITCDSFAFQRDQSILCSGDSLDTFLYGISLLCVLLHHFYHLRLCIMYFLITLGLKTAHLLLDLVDVLRYRYLKFVEAGLFGFFWHLFGYKTKLLPDLLKVERSEQSLKGSDRCLLPFCRLCQFADFCLVGSGHAPIRVKGPFNDH